MDISKITDIKELKALKSDEHDKIIAAQQQIEISQRNINNLLARINEILDKPQDENQK